MDRGEYLLLSCFGGINIKKKNKEKKKCAFPAGMDQVKKKKKKQEEKIVVSESENKRFLIKQNYIVS